MAELFIFGGNKILLKVFMGTILERTKKLVPLLASISLALLPSYSFAAPKWKKIISNSATGSLQGSFQEFSQDGTFTVPAGVTKIQVTVIGGGGGAGVNGSIGGGGGGGSCIKNGATVLASADGGAGGAATANGLPGSKTVTSLTVTPGTTLNVFVGGGGGGAVYNTTNGYFYGGSGGYGPCGSGGAGGGSGAASGGAGGLNKGGGGGALSSTAGTASTSSTGGSSFYNQGSGNVSCGAATGGSSSSAGTGNSCGAGGGSGGIGGCYFGNAGVAMNSITCFYGLNIQKDPGEPGHSSYVVIASVGMYSGTGGGGGAVYISW